MANGGRARRLLFMTIVAVSLALVAEILSFIALSIVDHRSFSWTRLQAERQSRFDEIPKDVLPGTARDDAYRFLSEEVLHPYLGYVYDPQRTPTGNDLGFVDDQSPLHRRSPDTMIVGILGGSFAQMFSVEGAATLERELSDCPRFAGKKIVFVRAALAGFKQPQQLMTLNYLLALGAEFDVVINLDGFNEVALFASENEPHGVFAAYPRAWYLRVVDVPDPVVRSTLAEMTWLRTKRIETARFFSHTLLRISATANLVWRCRDRWLDRSIADKQLALRTYRPDERRYVATGPSRSYATDAERYDDLAALWQRCSTQLDRLCRGNGIAYFHFLQPNQYVAGSKVLTDEEREKAYNTSHPYKTGVELGYPVLIRKGEELLASGVAFTDLTQVFADVKERVYADSCCHLNHVGYEMIARAIARTIRRALG
ncbi:MAG: hypothetical protein HYR85_12040 [Planctomycetes bacterium]|nr:hypothetical protein [Planctomycetota bacterium]MBI3844403.1 hypothetical protein [Planctomycetota bacterium]